MPDQSAFGFFARAAARGIEHGDVPPARDASAAGRGRPAASGLDAAELIEFFRNAPCGFHALDASGVIVEVNDTELAMLQRRREDVVGRLRFVDLLSPLSKRRFVREFPTFKRTGRVEGLSFDLLRRDGSTIPILLSATAVLDAAGHFVRSRSVIMVDRTRNLPEESLQEAYAALETTIAERTSELTTVIGTLREEIEDRERAESLLRQSEERAVAVINSVVDGVITIDEAGFVETMNPAAERMSGWREREILGRSALLLLAEPFASQYASFFRRPRDGAALIGSSRELQGLRRDGVAFPIEVALSEMRLASRRLLIASVRDLTEKKRAEEQLDAMTKEVRRHEWMAMIGSLVAGFAHEARNPLFGISAVLDALAARFGEGSEYAEHFTLLRRDVRRLNDLMKDLLEFGRPASPLQARPIGGVVTQAISECALLARSANVAIVAEVADSSVEIAMNDRLVRAIQNLLQNAVQFSASGATVTLSTSRQEPGWLECSVRDVGPGIAPADLPRLFEPFFTRRRGGTGLGLAIVQRIVEEHRGSITATNHPEGGACMRVRLPVTEGAA
jgi:PAS domain S-box-containing protein